MVGLITRDSKKKAVWGDSLLLFFIHWAFCIAHFTLRNESYFLVAKFLPAESSDREIFVDILQVLADGKVVIFDKSLV